MQPTNPLVSFIEADTRQEAMERTVNTWVDSLAAAVASGDGHDRVARWLDVQARFPREPARNALLIALQKSDAERLAPERVWTEEYEREVCAGAEPIWLWEPQIERCCPECDQAVADHDRSDCEYDGLAIEHWPRYVVDYTAVPVYDVAQTTGRQLPADASPSVRAATTRTTRLLAAAPRLGIDLRVVPGAAWSHGQRAVRFAGPTSDGRQRVDLRQRRDGAFPTEAAVQAFATARLHTVSDPDVTIARGGDALAATVIVCEAVEIEFDAPSLSLGAWRGDDVEALTDRLERIRCVAREVKTAYRRPEELMSP